VINLGKPWRDSIDTIDWNQPHLDLLLNEWFNVELEYLTRLKNKIQPNSSVTITSGAGPFLPVFKNMPNVTVGMNWPYFPAYHIFEHCKNTDYIKTLNHKQQFLHTVSTFNGTWHWSRLFLTLYLYKNELWHDDFCSKSKILTCRLEKLKEWKDGDINTVIAGISKNQLKKFLLHHNEFNYQRYPWNENLTSIAPIMKNTFATIVSESYAEGTEPFFSEKPFFCIVNKSIFITLAQPDYYSVMNNCFGFKNYNCFDYSFDSEKNMVTRLEMIINQIKKISKLSPEDQAKLHNENLDIIEYNFEHFMSGDWMKQCESSLNDLDRFIPRQYNL